MIEKDYYNGWNDESNLNKILSCPFCGGNGELLDNRYEHPVIDENGAYVDMDIFEGDTFWIECEKCGAMITGADTPEKAIEEWNKRTGSGWIPVEERLPEKEYYTALCVTDKNHYCVAVYNREYGFRTGDIDVEGEIIAWQPLPEPYSPEPLETRKELEEDSKGVRENETD